MDKYIIFVCTEQRQTYFRGELCKSIKKLKEEAITKSSDLNCISLSSICVSGRATSSPGSPTVTDTLSVLKHNITDENPLEQLPPILDLPSASDPNSEEDFRSADFLAVAEKLHSLADGFGVPGSYLVYVIWCIEAYVPDPGEVCEVYAALHRLQSWHRACLVMASPDPICVQGWSAALPLHLTADTTHVVLGALQCIWRGDLCSGDGGGVGEKGGERLTDLVINCTGMQSVLSMQRKKHGGNIFLLDECSVVSSVQLSSVPCLLAHPGGLYQLCSALDTTPEQAEHNAATLEQLTDSDQVGALLRLHYSHTPPVLGASGPQALTTEEWRRQLSEGAFDTAPTLTLQGPQHTLHLLAVTCRRGTVLAVGLRSPDSLGEDVWRLVSNTPGISSFSNTNAQDIEQKMDKLLQETTFLSKKQMDVLAHLQMHLPARITKKLLNKGNNLSTLWEQTKDDLEALASQEVLALLHSRGDGATFTQLQRDQGLKTTEVEQEHHEWPEYQALVAAELREQRANNQRSTGGQLLGGIAPPRSPDTIITLDAAHLSKTFRQDPLLRSVFYNKIDSKKRSAVTSTENDSINGAIVRKKLYSTMDHYPFKTNASSTEAISAGFPESLYINYHDIYYNRDQRREDFEEDCNKVRQRHIRRELASVCSSFHDGSQLYVTLPTSDGTTAATAARVDCNAAGFKEGIQQAGRTLAADGDTVSVRSAASSRKIALRKSPRKRPGLTGPETSGRVAHKMGIDSTGVSRPSDLLAPRSTSTSIKSSDLMAPKKSSVKPSDLLAPKKASMGQRAAPPPGRVRRPQAIVSAELSDAHKQKLRGAVLTALEDEGISMKNPLFKMCFKKLFAVCRPFATDVIGRGSTSRNMEKIARAHVKQVIDFERRLDKR